MYKWCWCLGLIKQLRSHWPLKRKAERGKLEIRKNKQSHPTQKHFNMPTNCMRRATEEMEGKCNRPKLNICQTWWKKRWCFLFCFHIHANMFLPADSELHLWIIWHFFWQQELCGNFKASFSDKHEYQYLNTLPIFQKLIFLMHWSRVECFLFQTPSREEFNVCCILFCSEWHLKLASDEVYFLRLHIQTRPGK